MNWQQAGRELRKWEEDGCDTWYISCPITHTSHSSCPGLTRAAHNLMFARLNEHNAKGLREEIARI